MLRRALPRCQSRFGVGSTGEVVPKHFGDLRKHAYTSEFVKAQQQAEQQHPNGSSSASALLELMSASASAHSVAAPHKAHEPRKSKKRTAVPFGAWRIHGKEDNELAVSERAGSHMYDRHVEGIVPELLPRTRNVSDVPHTDAVKALLMSYKESDAENDGRVLLSLIADAIKETIPASYREAVSIYALQTIANRSRTNWHVSLELLRQIIDKNYSSATAPLPATVIAAAIAPTVLYSFESTLSAHRAVSKWRQQQQQQQRDNARPIVHVLLRSLAHNGRGGDALQSTWGTAMSIASSFLSHPPPNSPSDETFALLIKAVSVTVDKPRRGEQQRRAERVLDYVDAHHPAMRSSATLWTSYIETSCSWGRAMRLFVHNLPHYRVKADVAMFSALIRLCAEAGQAVVVRRIVAESRAAGVPLSSSGTKHALWAAEALQDEAEYRRLVDEQQHPK
eukprot:PhM_4_TR15809/c0_g1_i1/m.31881